MVKMAPRQRQQINIEVNCSSTDLGLQGLTPVAEESKAHLSEQSWKYSVQNFDIGIADLLINSLVLASET